MAGPGRWVPMLSIGRQTPEGALGATSWVQLLDSEESLVAAQGFGAGVLVVNYSGELLRHADEDSRALTEAAVLAHIERHLGWTDRREPVGPGRLGVVVVPVDGPLALVRRARGLHDDLRTRGLHVDVAYALRRRTGGLWSAAARADAALDTVLARRAKSGG